MPMEGLTQTELEATAAAYEELLVPALFRQWADQLANTAEIDETSSVLDVACGTGVLARAVASREGFTGSVTGLDPNPGMLAVARRSAPDIDWRRGTAEALPFPDETFDIVVSQFGLMLFTSPRAALQEMSRVLRSGGDLLVAVFDSLGTMPAYEAMADVFERSVGRSVGEALRFPFSMGDTEELYSLFLTSGVPNPVITTHRGTARFSSPRHMVLSDVRGWFPFAGIQLADETIESVVNEAESALRPFRTSRGTVRFDVSVHIVRARKS